MAEEIARIAQIERLEAQVLKLEQAQDEAKVVLDRLRLVEQSRENDANKATDARKAIDARIESIKSLQSKTLSDVTSRAPQLQEALESFKTMSIPPIPSFDGKQLQESLDRVQSKILVGDFSFSDIPEDVALVAASGAAGLLIVAAIGSSLQDEDNSYNETYVGSPQDKETSAPYGMSEQSRAPYDMSEQGRFPPSTSSFSQLKPSTGMSEQWSFGNDEKQGSFGSTKSSFGSAPSKGIGKSGMGAGSGFSGESSSTSFGNSRMGTGSGFSSPMKGSAAGSTFTQAPKGGSFGNFKSSYGSGQGGKGLGGTTLSDKGSTGAGGGLSSVSGNPTVYPSPFGKGGYRTMPSKGSANAGSKSFGKTSYKGKQ
jgi:hypothetical protein